MKIDRLKPESAIVVLVKELEMLKGSKGITVDDFMSATSTNPVQNKVILQAIQEIPKGEKGDQGIPGKVGTFEVDDEGNLYYIEPE